MRARLPGATEVELADWLIQDEDLFGISVAMGYEDLIQVSGEICEQGLVQGQDFVLTASGQGVIGSQPDWLEMYLGPSGNPPELEAKMEPEVRAMWERTRPRMLALRAGS